MHGHLVAKTVMADLGLFGMMLFCLTLTSKSGTATPVML